MAKITIILNVYNGIKTLKDTLDSIMSQTWKDWELLFWDDASTDQSATILEEYPDSRIKYFSSGAKKPSGLGNARRVAIKEATGEWIAFIDQDDIWLPSKLALQMKAIEANPKCGLVYGRTLTFFDDDQKRSKQDYDHRHEYSALPQGDIFKSLFVDSCFIAMSSSMFLRSAINSIKEIPAHIKVSPDYYLYLAISRHYQACAVDQVICLYRVHANNMTHYSGVQMQNEILSLITSWKSQIGNDLVQKRLKIHNTVKATHQLRDSSLFVTGIKTLLLKGDVFYLISRPFVKTYRNLKRKMKTPYWLLTNNEALDISSVGNN